jgi:hypothetical protein
MMRRKSLAAMVAVTALGFGGVAPAAGIAKSKAKTKSAKAKTVKKAGPEGLFGLCGALQLEALLEGLTIDLTPIAIVRVPDVCGP